MNWEETNACLAILQLALNIRLDWLHDNVPAKGRGDVIRLDPKMQEIRKALIELHQQRIKVNMERYHCLVTDHGQSPA